MPRRCTDCPGKGLTGQKEAEPLLQRALRILEASLSPGHPSTQTARANLTQLEATLRSTPQDGDSNRS